MGNVILFLIAAGIPCGLFCAFVANAKGLYTVNWFFGGLFFNFIALIAVAGMPSKK